MRFIIDTNVLVSAVIANGAPRQLLDRVLAGDVEFVTSDHLVNELRRVLSRQRFAPRLAQSGLTPKNVVDDLYRLAVISNPSTVPRIVMTDPDDDHVLAAAVQAKAHLIVTGDKRDLLSLGQHQGIDIVSPAEALRRMDAL